MKNISPKALTILHWSLLLIAAVLIAFQLIQLIAGGRSNEALAWTAIILILIDLAITRFVRSKKSKD